MLYVRWTLLNASTTDGQLGFNIIILVLVCDLVNALFTVVPQYIPASCELADFLVLFEVML